MMSMSYVEAAAYLKEHALTEKEQRLIALFLDMVEISMTDDYRHLFSIIAHLLTDTVCICLEEEGHALNPEVCAEKSAIAVQFFETLLHAKILLQASTIAQDEADAHC